MFMCCYRRSKYKKKVQVSNVMSTVDNANAKRLKVETPRLHFLLRRASIRQLNFLFEQGHDLKNKNVDIHLKYTTKNEVSP